MPPPLPGPPLSAVGHLWLCRLCGALKPGAQHPAAVGFPGGGRPNHSIRTAGAADKHGGSNHPGERQGWGHCSTMCARHSAGARIKGYQDSTTMPDIIEGICSAIDKLVKIMSPNSPYLQWPAVQHPSLCCWRQGPVAEHVRRLGGGGNRFCGGPAEDGPCRRIWSARLCEQQLDSLGAHCEEPHVCEAGSTRSKHQLRTERIAMILGFRGNR